MVDSAAIDKGGAADRLTQNLLDPTSGAKSWTIQCIKTAAGGGFLAGLHIHYADQIFYTLRSKMSVEIEGKQYNCSPGSLIIFPAGVRHRNWNGSSKPRVHLGLQYAPARPFAKLVCPGDLHVGFARVKCKDGNRKSPFLEPFTRLLNFFI